jgi:hypothetical protein
VVHHEEVGGVLPQERQGRPDIRRIPNDIETLVFEDRLERFPPNDVLINDY